MSPFPPRSSCCCVAESQSCPRSLFRPSALIPGLSCAVTDAHPILQLLLWCSELCWWFGEQHPCFPFTSAKVSPKRKQILMLLMDKRLMEKSDYKRCDAKKSVDSSSSLLPRMRSLSLLHYPKRRCQPCTSPFPPSFFLSPFPQKLLEALLWAVVGVICSLCKWGRFTIGKCWWGAVCEEGGDCRAPCNASGGMALAVTERNLQISGSVGHYVPLLSPTGQWECGNPCRSWFLFLFSLSRPLTQLLCKATLLVLQAVRRKWIFSVYLFWRLGGM